MRKRHAQDNQRKAVPARRKGQRKDPGIGAARGLLRSRCAGHKGQADSGRRGRQGR